MSRRFLWAVPCAAMVLFAAPALAGAPAKETPKQGDAKPPSGRAGPGVTPEETIEKALGAKTSCEFIDTPLRDVVDFLRDRHAVNVIIDKKALDDVGIGTDTPITARISDVSFRSALELVLRPLSLTWTIHDEVLLITTAGAAETMLLAKVYDVADLVACRDEKGALWGDYGPLIEAILRCVAPRSWPSAGGWAEICGLSAGDAQVLVVRQTPPVHDQVGRLLEQLREIARKSPDYGKPALKDRPPAPPPRPLPKKKPVKEGWQGGGGSFF